MISGRRALPFSTLPQIVTVGAVPCNTACAPPGPDEHTASMKLNVKNIRYLAADDWRVLTAVCARVPALLLVVGDEPLMKTMTDRDGQPQP